LSLPTPFYKLAHKIKVQLYNNTPIIPRSQIHPHFKLVACIHYR
jgi:hypothetical protein